MAVGRFPETGGVVGAGRAMESLVEATEQKPQGERIGAAALATPSVDQAEALGA